MKRSKEAKEGFVKRLKEFVGSTGLSQRKFGALAGLSEEYIKTCSGNIQPYNRRKIEAAYPQLNWNWLETGEGEMIKKDIEPSITISNIRANNFAGRDQIIGGDKSSLKEAIIRLKAENKALQARCDSQQELIDKLINKLIK